MKYAIFYYPTKRGFLNVKKRLLSGELDTINGVDWMSCQKASAHYEICLSDLHKRGLKKFFLVVLRDDGYVMKSCEFPARFKEVK